MTLGRDHRDYKPFDPSTVAIPVMGFDNSPRAVPGKKEGDATKTFADLRLCLTEEQVRKEAARCLGCGATTVDTNRCIGCGLCTTKCHFDAIHLHRDHPDASNMCRAEDKLGKIAAYAAKRAGKILIRKIKGGKEEL